MRKLPSLNEKGMNTIKNPTRPREMRPATGAADLDGTLKRVHTHTYPIEARAMFEAHDKLSKMRETVHEELKHIPRGSIEQNMFRAQYQVGRMNSMGKKAQNPDSKEAVMKDILEFYKKKYPDFEPQYDRQFFRQKAVSEKVRKK